MNVSFIVGNYVPEDADFLCDKAAIFGETIKETPSKMKHQEETFITFSVFITVAGTKPITV
jgi:hypothetical protein